MSTLALSPISFGPLQLRVGGLLVPLALLHPAYGIGLAIGTAISNLVSPFGWYDFVVMPLAMAIITQIGYTLRQWPIVALVTMASLVALCVAIFPLYLGGMIPVWPTVLFLFLSFAGLYLGGWYLLWRPLQARLTP